MTTATVDFAPTLNAQGLIEMTATYALELTQNDVDYIGKAGHDYSWSDFLLTFGVKVGKNALPTDTAWDFWRVVSYDTENYSKKLPSAPTPLAEKLWSLLSSLV